MSAALATGVITSYSDAWRRTTNILASSVTATQNLAQSQKDVIQIAKDSRAPLEQTAKLYAGLSASASELNASQEDIAKFTELAAKSLAVGGASAGEAAGALLQLRQAIGGTVIQAQEFNSLIDGARPLLQAVARGSDRFAGSVNKLREAVKGGTVTSKEFFEAALKGSDFIDKKFNKTLATFAQNMTLASNAATEYIGTNETMTSTVDLAGEAVVFLSDNLDTISNVVLVAAIAGMTKFTIGAATNTAALISNMLALEARSAAGLVAARNQQAASLVMFRHAVLTGNATKAAASLASANTALAAASVTAAAGVGLLSRSMAFLGGPLGVVLLAASAISIYALSAKDARTPTEKLADEVDELSKSFGKLNEGQLEAKLIDTIGQVEILRAKVKNINDNPLKGSKLLGGSEIAVQKLNAQLAEAIKLRDALFAAGITKRLEGATDQSGLTGLDEPEKQKKEDDPFINNERFKTASLKAELNERLEVQRLFNELTLSEFSSVGEQERAISEFNRMVELAALETKKTQSNLDFEQRREALLVNDKLTSEARLVLGAELELQELDQRRLFELEKTDIEQQAADDRVAIARNEFSAKLNEILGFGQMALNLNQIFGSKSEKATKKRRKREIHMNAAGGIIRAWAEHEFYEALGMTIAIAASKRSQLAALEGGGSSTPSVSITRPPPERQEPVSGRLIVENRGLSEVAALLATFDPADVFPVELTQRIVASLELDARLGGD